MPLLMGQKERHYGTAPVTAGHPLPNWSVGGAWDAAGPLTRFCQVTPLTGTHPTAHHLGAASVGILLLFLFLFTFRLRSIVRKSFNSMTAIPTP